MSARSVIEKHYAAGASGNFETMIEDFADDIRWREAPGGAYGGTYIGKNNVIEGVFAKINQDWEGFGAIPELLIADEPSGIVAALCRYVGRNRKTGRHIDAKVVHIWFVEGETIVAMEQVGDSVEQMKAMR